MKDYLNSFAEKAATQGFTFKFVSEYGRGKVYTATGEVLPEVYRPALFFTFSCDPNTNGNSREKERAFMQLVRRNKSIGIACNYSIHYGYAYYIATAADAETIIKDGHKKEVELEKYWQAEHEKRIKQTASA